LERQSKAKAKKTQRNGARQVTQSPARFLSTIAYLMDLRSDVGKRELKGVVGFVKEIP
jgi:hypothetical protein